MTTNLLHIHIVSCRNLQLMMRWWLWFTLRCSLQKLWGSCTLDVQILIEFWGGLLPLPVNWISHGILVLVWFLVRKIRLWYMCLSRSIIDCSWSVTNSSISTTFVPTWCSNASSTITTMPDWDASCEEIVQFNSDMLDIRYHYIHQRWMISKPEAY